MPLRALAAVAALALLTGCKTTEPKAKPTPPAADEPCDCCDEEPAACAPFQPTYDAEQVSAPVYYMDSDGGDDPFTEGCLYTYSDAQCTLNMEAVEPDFCCQGSLFEHAADDCTNRPLFSVYDCARHCQQTVGSPSGRCVDVPDPCKGYPPPGPGPQVARKMGAKCVCN